MTANELLEIETLDLHTGGEPLRIVRSGWPDIPGDTIVAKRAYAREHHDHLRRALMLEPRGHADMYGALVTPPVTDDGHLGVLFMHNAGFSTMCGHGIIALVTAALERRCFEGLPHPDADGTTTLRIDTPAGRVTARARAEAGRVASVEFLNVPSFVLLAQQSVEVPGVGSVVYDLAFGGAFYAYVDAEPLGLSLDAAGASELVRAGRAIKAAVSSELGPAIAHPTGEADLGFLYGTIFVGAAQGDAHSRNVCVFADGEVDRSPTGTGVSGRAAIHHLRGELADDTWIRIESIVGSAFDVKVAATTTVGPHAAIVPRVRGSAHITGRHTFEIDPADPFAHGFFLR